MARTELSASIMSICEPLHSMLTMKRQALPVRARAGPDRDEPESREAPVSGDVNLIGIGNLSPSSLPASFLCSSRFDFYRIETRLSLPQAEFGRRDIAGPRGARQPPEPGVERDSGPTVSRQSPDSTTPPARSRGSPLPGAGGPASQWQVRCCRVGFVETLDVGPGSA